MGIGTSKTEQPECCKRDDTLRFGCGQDVGRKTSMEDASCARVLGVTTGKRDVTERSPCVRGFFVVCDGHGGADAAQFTSQNLLKYFLLEKDLDVDAHRAMYESFIRADTEFSRQVSLGKQRQSGTTALAIAVFGHRMILGNAGDCRAVLSHDGVAKGLTQDHRPITQGEKDRIVAAGGFVDCEGYMCGDLGVSRAIGDHHYEHLKTKDGTGPLIAAPEITEHHIEDCDEFVLVVSDGVTDSMTNQTMVDLVRDSLRQHNCPEIASKALVAAALKTGIRDNLTAMTVCFKPDPPSQKKIPNSKSRQRMIDLNSKSFADLLKATGTES